MKYLLDTTVVSDFARGTPSVLGRLKSTPKKRVAIRAALSKRGTPIGPYDIMIAGTAVRHGLIMVTSNAAEFGRIDGLLLEDWREAT